MVAAVAYEQTDLVQERGDSQDDFVARRKLMFLAKLVKERGAKLRHMRRMGFVVLELPAEVDCLFALLFRQPMADFVARARGLDK